MELSKALEAARATNHSVFTTIRSNGLPQLSNVTHHTDADGIIRISTTANRAKYINLTRRPWAALKVDGPSFWSYAVLEGDVELSKIAAVADDQTVEELIMLYPKSDDITPAQVAPSFPPNASSSRPRK